MINRTIKNLPVFKAVSLFHIRTYRVRAVLMPVIIVVFSVVAAFHAFTVLELFECLTGLKTLKKGVLKCLGQSVHL